MFESFSISVAFNTRTNDHSRDLSVDSSVTRAFSLTNKARFNFADNYDSEYQLGNNKVSSWPSQLNPCIKLILEVGHSTIRTSLQNKQLFHRELFQNIYSTISVIISSLSNKFTKWLTCFIMNFIVTKKYIIHAKVTNTFFHIPNTWI